MADTVELKCSKCKVVKDILNYYPNKCRFNGYASECKSCGKATRLKRRRRLLNKGICWSSSIRPLHTKWHCKECTDERNTNNKFKYLKVKSVVYQHYGNKCACCAEGVDKFLK